jgi:hypothetical protein
MFKSIEGVKILSFLPGRVKLRIEAVKGEEALAKKATAQIGAINAIKKIMVDPGKGDVLINYDRKKIKEPDTINALSDTLSELFPDMDVAALRAKLE